MSENIFRDISLNAHWAAVMLTVSIVGVTERRESRHIAIESARDDLARVARLIPDDGSIPETMSISVREALEVVDRAVSGEADDPQSLVPALRVAERVEGWAGAMAHMASAPASNNGRRHHE